MDISIDGQGHEQLFIKITKMVAKVSAEIPPAVKRRDKTAKKKCRENKEKPNYLLCLLLMMGLLKTDGCPVFSCFLQKGRLLVGRQ